VWTGGGVRSLTTARVCMGTQPATSRLPKSAAGIRTKEICVTSYSIEMHAAGLKTGTYRETTSSMNDARVVKDRGVTEGGVNRS
jgi:hypothetical protein